MPQQKLCSYAKIKSARLWQKGADLGPEDIGPIVDDVEGDDDSAHGVNPPNPRGDACDGSACDGAKIGGNVVAVVLRERQHGLAAALKRHAIQQQDDLDARGRAQNGIQQHAHLKLWQLPCSGKSSPTKHASSLSGSCTISFFPLFTSVSPLQRLGSW